MSCPQCNSDKIGSDGICLICGATTTISAPAPVPVFPETSGQRPADAIETAQSGDSREPFPKEEIPRWRLELSQRLNALRQSKDAIEGAGQPQIENGTPRPQNPDPGVGEHPRTRRTEPAEKAPVRRATHGAQRSPERPKPSPPQQKTLESLGSDVAPEKPAQEFSGRADVRQFIDKAVARQSPHGGKGTPLTEPRPVPEHEGKLILLSRTLSGLIDLIFIVLCTGAFIISADYFSGIVVLDLASVVDYSVLLVLTYFLYSIFFLAASNQTLGMMITDLRVVGTDNRRPSMIQLVYRCSGYLISLAGLGIGLLWSLVNHKNLCLHDRLSRTYVIRV